MDCIKARIGEYPSQIVYNCMFIKMFVHMKKKLKKYKVGMDSETYAISLVESPAIEEELVALEKQEPIKIQLANEEKHMVYSAVLIPDKPIYRRNADGDEYYLEFSKESIEKMSQEFMKEYRQAEITVDHMDIAPEVTVVESWIKADLYKDKSVALGLNEELPVGTWFSGMKVNNVDVWERIKAGELRGFSVESMVSLEEFNNQENNDNMEIETNEMFWTKLKNVFNEILEKVSLKKQEDVDVETSEATKITPNQEKLEEQTPTVEPTEVVEPTPEPQNEPKVEEPTVTTEEPKEEVVEAPEETKPNPLEELVKSLKDEVDALRKMNSSLDKKVKEMSKQPSAQPVNTNAKPTVSTGVDGSAYQNWRETMRQMIG